VAYCERSDLLTGDIPLASKYGNGENFVNLAADEIDAQIGHIYVTPIVFDESTPTKVAKVRPSKLLLKKINTLLASGRIILDMAAGGEDNNLHAYGRSMVREAINLLEQICDRKILLVDAPLIDTEADNDNTGPIVVTEDPYSLVEGFYTRYNKHHLAPVYPLPMRPYDDPPVAQA
jgi:hypothetical protein